MSLEEFWALLRQCGPWRLVAPPGLIRDAAWRCPVEAVAWASGVRSDFSPGLPQQLATIAKKLGLDQTLAELLVQASDNLPRLYRRQGWEFDLETDLVADLRALMLDACNLTEQED